MLNDFESHERLLADNDIPREKVPASKSTNSICLRLAFILIIVLLALGVGFFAGMQTANYKARQPLYPNAVPRGA